MEFKMEVPAIGEKISYWTNNFTRTQYAIVVEYRQSKYKLKVLLELEDKSRIWKNIFDLVYKEK